MDIPQPTKEQERREIIGFLTALLAAVIVLALLGLSVCRCAYLP